METIDIATLAHVTGGNMDFEQVKEKARPYCPSTVAKYSKLDPTTIDRAKAQEMGDACVAEMPFFMRGMARGQMQAGIDEAFPR